MTAQDLLTAIEKPKQLEDDNEGYEFLPFYTINYDKDGNTGKVTIDYLKLVNLLNYLGFRRLDIGRQPFIVRIKDNIVEEYQQKDVIDVFEDYLMSFPENLPDGVMRDKILSRIYSNLATYFSNHVLYRLRPSTEIVFNEHRKNAAYFYYQNGYVEVTAEGVYLKSYAKLKKCIWKDQILDRNFQPADTADYENTSWAQFVKNISNNYRTRFYDNKLNEPDYERYKEFKAIIGYGLHAFFEAKQKGVILTDSRVDENPNGRTGKTLILKAMGKMLNAQETATVYTELNGKDFDPKDRFKYQELGLDTKLVHINDASAYFDFESLFNDITEGIKAQRKNEQPRLVKAKVFITSNKTIRLHGESAKDRSLEFEMADYYCSDNGPDREFKEWFFRDWDDSMWNLFDNFMLSCVQTYLGSGLIKPETINLNFRKLIEETKQEFADFMSDQNIKHLEKYNKKDLYILFIHRYPDFNAKLTQRTFTKWLRLYGEYHPDVEDLIESRSNSADFVEFVLTEKRIAETDWKGEKELTPDDDEFWGK